MSTTSLFVELIVIGVGAGIWIVLAVFSLFGIPGLSQVSFSRELWLTVLVPMLSIVYVLGIVIDRVADRILAPWSWAMQRQVFGATEDYYRARTTVYLRSETLTDLYEYGRSRLRICRGWILNAVLILIAFDVLAARQAGAEIKGRLWIAGTVGFGLLAVGAATAWRGLTMQELIRLREQFHQLTSDNPE